MTQATRSQTKLMLLTHRVANTAKSLVPGFVLSLSLSSKLFLASNAQFLASDAQSSAASETAMDTGVPKPTETVGPTPSPKPMIVAPSAFFGVASTSSKDFVYYQGGRLLNPREVQFSGELFSLDLTKSWPILSPAWTNLTLPSNGMLIGPSVAGHGATMSKDGSMLLVTAPTASTTTPFLYQYNVSARTWSTVNAPSANAAVWKMKKNAHFITDPFTGASWLFGGQLPDASYVIEMDKFQDDTWTVTFPVIPAPTLVPAHYFGGTAHIYRNKIFNFGGIKATESRGYQSFGNLSYIDISLWPPVLGWRETLGEIPPERAYHCSVLTSSRKVIIFGGYDFMTKMTLQDVWSLDMLTSTWTQIITTNPPRPRYGHNCDIAGANMIVYGGMANNTHGYPQDIQIYDVMLSTWMASYTPKLDTAPVPQPHHEYLDSSGSPGIGIGSIISIIAAVLVVVACILGFIFYKHRQKQNDIHETEMEKKAYLASMRPEGGHSFGSQSALYNPLDVA